jgi:hypothetical protein
LAALPSQKLRQVELLEWIGTDVANGSIAIGFTLTEAQWTVFNALDENGLEHIPPGFNYRRHPLAL